VRWTPLVALFALTRPVAAQTNGAAAAATITEADIRRRIEVVAHDSMGGRDTPSRGLDLAAEYVASEFRRLGLRPAGQANELVSRFPITTRRLVPGGSTVKLGTPNGEMDLGIGRQSAVLFGHPAGSYPVVLLGGPVDSLTAARTKGHAVLWVRDWRQGPPRDLETGFQALIEAGAGGVALVVNNPMIFANMTGGEARDRLTVGDGESGPFAIGLSDSAVAARSPGSRLVFAQLRAATAPMLLAEPGWSLAATLRDTVVSSASAPNVAAVIEGSDSALKHEYLVFSAHMDHVGSECKGSGQSDSICNGADDNASGTVGLIELAEAFMAPGARPKRSLIFLGISGEEKGLWGSQVFTKNPPVEIRSMVANLNMDMIGRNWKDTVVAIGMEHSELGEILGEVTAANSDLGVKAVDDLWPQERLYYRSDHYNFAVRGVPILFFTSGLHDDYHAVSDSPEKIDAEKEARVLRLIFLLGQEIANRPNRPKWKPESYRAIVQPADQIP